MGSVERTRGFECGDEALVSKRAMRRRSQTTHCICGFALQILLLTTRPSSASSSYWKRSTRIIPSSQIMVSRSQRLICTKKSETGHFEDELSPHEARPQCCFNSKQELSTTWCAILSPHVRTRYE